MAQYTRIEVINNIIETGVVPAFYDPDPEVCIEVLKACYEGGIRVFELTNRGDFAHEIFGELVKYATKKLPGMILGIGSVVDSGTTALYIQLGANFIVSPVLKEDMAIVCNRRKILWIPGCGSLSEISKAEELGAEIVKVFPAMQVGGPDFIKNIKAPCPWTSIMPTGGVEPEEENLRKWFNAGAVCVGMGSKLLPKDLIKEKKYDEISRKISNTLEIVKKIKNK